MTIGLRTSFFAVADSTIDDIRPPYFYYGHGAWWMPLALMLAALLSAWLLFFLWPKRQLSARSAYEVALEKLDQARALLREDSAMPYAVLVSETIRAYLSQRFHAPSTRRTTQEFLRQMDANPGAPLAAHRELLRDFLQACDLVKFARYQPRLAELESVQQSARNFVLATKPEPETARRREEQPA